MSENDHNSSNTRNILIGAAAAVVVAAFAGYQVGFGNGESGLKEVQDKLGQLEETAKTQAGKVEEQAATLTSQASDLEARAAEVKTQAEQIEKLNADVTAKAGEVEDLTGRLATKTAEAEALSGKLTAAASELQDIKNKFSGISTRLGEAERHNEDYLNTIMAGMRKRLLLLHVGGLQETLIENNAAIGLSFVSRPDKTARITLSGEQLVLKLQQPERVRIEGRACEVTLVNLISDTDAMLELSCGG